MTTARLPVIEHGWLLAAVIVVAACAYSSFWAPAMSMLADRAEEPRPRLRVRLRLINLAWAPGAAGAALGGAVARATTDGVVYGALAALCVVTLVTLTPRLREPAPASPLTNHDERALPGELAEAPLGEPPEAGEHVPAARGAREHV